MQPKFPRIGLTGKLGNPRTLPLVIELLQALRTRPERITLEQRLGERVYGSDPSINGLPTATLRELGREVDLIIVIGGDGTLLATARAVASSATPLLGINLGRLGFMVDILPEHAIRDVGAVLDGACRLEPRAMLEASIIRGGQTVHRGLALNDTVLRVQQLVRILEFDTFINGLDVGRVRADGMIIATPTGSTAYALSAGGPILSPELECLVLVPICPHSLSHRPLVVGADASIEIRLSSDSRSPAQIALDGQENLEFLPGDTLRVRWHSKGLNLVHPGSHNFLSMLRTKLRWGEHP